MGTLKTPSYQITITSNHGYVYFSWERGDDRETPITSLTYNLTIFDAGSWQILYGPNLGPEHINPGCSYNLQMEDIWREAEYLWLGKFNGTHQMVDCGCPDCPYPCGLATDGSEDCVVCDDYSITIAAADSPFFILEFEDGFGLISGTSNPNISFSGSIDLGINYDACHRDETTITPYTFMTLRQNAATCFPEPNNCYPFGGFFTFADEDIIEATIMSVPGELEVELTEYEYDDFIGHSYTFPNLTASPILGLYEFGWYGFFTLGPRFTIPDVFTDEETRRRELSLTQKDYTLGTCDPPEKNDEEYRYSNLSLQASAIRIEPPLRFLPYCEDDPESCAQEFTVIIDYPDDKYIIDLEIVTEDGGGQAYFQESGTTLLEQINNEDIYPLVATSMSNQIEDLKIVATLGMSAKATGRKQKAIITKLSNAKITLRCTDMTSGTIIQQVEDGESCRCEVIIENLSGLTPTDYEWSYEFPDGAGNDPSVSFIPEGDGKAAYVTPKWFALPNSRCEAALIADHYSINCTISCGQQYYSQSTALKVGLPDQGVETRPAQLLGLPNISDPDGPGPLPWQVDPLPGGLGELERFPAVVPPENIYLSANSQFYPKAVENNNGNAHEQIHLKQWNDPDGMAFKFYQPLDFYNLVKDLTAPSETELRDAIIAQKIFYEAQQDLARIAQKSCREFHAYSVSDTLPPLYGPGGVYENCGRYTENNCN